MRIKRYLSLFLVVLVSVFALGLANKDVKAETVWDYQETFDQVESDSSYTAEQTFVSDLNDFSWSLRGRGDQTLDGKAWTLGNAADKSYIMVEASGGISNFSLDVVRAFTNSNTRTLELFVNDISFGTFSVSTSSDEKQTWAINDINVSGNVTIKVVSINTGSRGATIIDNFKWTKYTPNLNATVNQLFGPGNENLVPDISAEYGQDVVVPVTESGDNEFQFALVNGVIRNDFLVGEDYALPITDGLEVSLVYATEESHAVLFLDSNGKVLSNTWVTDGGNVTAPETVNLSKPGYLISDNPWLSNEGDTSLENITSSRVYRLQYELEEASKVNITVGETTTEYNYNDIVTLTSTNSNFKAWVDEEGNVLSTKETFKFTALVDRTITESDVEPTALPVVTMTNDLMLRETHQTFLGQLELREGDTLVEYGLVASEDVLLSQEQLTLDNADKLSSKVLVPATNEFMLSIPNNYVVVRAFVTVRNTNNEIETLYSDNQFDNVVVLTFNTDGGTEIDPLLVKKGTIATKPTNPTKGTNVFVGWFVEEVEFDFTQTITQDLEITAKWELPTIDKVREFNSGTSVEFLGIVTKIDNRNLFVQDETAAIYLYNANLPTGLEVGDMVRVEGSRSAYQGLEQIGSGATVTILSSDNELPIFETTNLSGIDSTQQSRLIAVSGLTVKEQSGSNLTLTDGTNDILLYAQTGTEVYDYIQGVIQGQTVNIYQGFIGWYNNNIQLEVGEVTHIEIVPLTDEELARIDLDKLIAEWDNQSFVMDTEVILPELGEQGSNIIWDLDPVEAIVDGKWQVVTEDTEVTIIVQVTKGDITLSNVILITILFVEETEPTAPITLVDFTSEGKAKLPDGWSHLGLGNDYSESRLRFDSTGDTLTTNSLNINSGSTIKVIVKGNMNTGGTTGAGVLEIKSGGTVIGEIILNQNPVTEYVINIILNLDVDKLTFRFVKDNGNLGLESIKVILNP